MTPHSLTLPLFTGLSYHVLEWAPADPACDHTVLLLHGYLDLAWGWRPVVEAGLAGRFHLAAPDMRGHGDSDRVGSGGYYHFMDYLADLHGLIDALGRTRVSLVGHSMGGTIASLYAGAFPERIHRLAVLEGMGPPVPALDMPRRIASWIEGWRRARGQPMRSYSDRDEAAARLRAHDSRLEAALADELAEHGTRAAPGGRVTFKHDPLHVTRGPYPFRLDQAQELWRNISCPTLLVEAADSRFLDQFGDLEQGRYAHVPHAERRVLEDAGHMMHRHQPTALAQMLAGFLDD
ncbi:alpha/beta fold hydrolase [Haliangium sp.]|uniref:alpha/beta fold hydrolase n=1 Tax=Haliangium sp. TaxID=2663208 RepID=UPI003D0ED790